MTTFRDSEIRLIKTKMVRWDVPDMATSSIVIFLKKIFIENKKKTYFIGFQKILKDICGLVYCQMLFIYIS